MLPEQQIVRFGLYTADLHTAELKKGQAIVPLQNLPFRILKLLLCQPGRIVTREEIRHELWPEDTFVDFERGISTAVSKLREALGDSAANPRFIETVGRRGYRFIAPVTVVSVDVVRAEPDTRNSATNLLYEHIVAQQGTASRTRAWSVVGRAVFLVAGIVVIAGAVLAFDWIARTPEPRVARMIQLTNSGKVIYGGGLFSDGSRIFIVEKDGTQFRLTQTSLNGGEEVAVPTPFPNAILLGISPDHSQMLLSKPAEYMGKHGLWIMPVQGGGSRRVGDLVLDHATWFPDGKRLLCSDDGQVFSVELDGSARRNLFKVDGEALRFAWKPDGSVFRFTVRDSRDTVALWEAAADGTNLRRVLPGWNQPPQDCCGVWTPDGKYYVFTSLRNGQTDLWALREPDTWSWVRRQKPVRLTNGPSSFNELLASPDGKRLFSLGMQVRERLLRFDEPSQQFLPSPISAGSVGDLAFSHDGQWVAWIGPPDLTLWRSRLDGSDKLQLTSPPAQALRPRWSPDGKQILFESQLPGQGYTAHVVGAEGGTPKSVLPDDRAYRDYVDWSPDGEQVLIGMSPGQDAGAGITLVDLKDGKASEIPGSSGMRRARWSPRGDYLIASSEEGKKIFLFDIHARQWRQVATANQLWKFEWERDGSYAYWQDIRDPGQAVFRFEPQTGKVERVLEFSKLLHSGAQHCSFQGRSPDGSFMVSVSTSWADLFALDLELP